MGNLCEIEFCLIFEKLVVKAVQTQEHNLSNV
jgi:hypothetical protein